MKRLLTLLMAVAVLGLLAAPTQAATLAGYWNLDENMGSTAADSGPLGKDGTLGGTYAWVPGISGSGVEFTGLLTGTDGWMDCEDVLGNIGTGDLTISLWVKSVKAQNFHILYEHGHTNSPGPGINISNDERAAYAGLRGQFREDATWDQAQEDGYVLDTEWHHIVLGRDGTSGKVLLYRDNAKVAEVDSTPMDMDLTDTTITWGNVGDVASGVYHNFGASAVLDDLQIYTGWIGESGVDFLFNNPGSSISSSGPLDGDLNDDGFVGGDDLDIVRSFWGQNVTAGDLLSGDPSGDGFVGGDDLDIVRANWGSGTPPAASAVPEPASFLLLVSFGLSLVTMHAWRRWH